MLKQSEVSLIELALNDSMLEDKISDWSSEEKIINDTMEHFNDVINSINDIYQNKEIINIQINLFKKYGIEFTPHDTDGCLADYVMYENEDEINPDEYVELDMETIEKVKEEYVEKLNELVVA